jgi:lysozyme
MYPPMEIDWYGLTQLRRLESCSLKAYWDRNGWAIGYGYHCPTLNALSTCTPEQAETWLVDYTETMSHGMCSLIKTNLINQGQFNALSCFVYNIGLTAFATSHVLQRLNDGQFAAVPDEMLRWIYSQHTIDPVLQTRRKIEVALWTKASNPQVTTQATV